MTKVTVPDGNVVAPRPSGGGNPLTGSRQSSFRFDLLDAKGKKFGELDGVQGGSVDWTASAAVKGAGTITVDLLKTASIEWTRTRIRPVMITPGLPEQPCGVFIPSAPTQAWDTAGGTMDVELLDRTTVLDQDTMDVTYAVAAGTNIVTAISDLIKTTGEDPGAVTPLDLALGADLVWSAGTTKLQIANDLLKAAGCFGLYADLFGQFRVEPYRTPGSRPVIYEFLDGDNCIYLPNHQIDYDIYSVPNKMVVTAAGGSIQAGYTGTATNEDPDSPFSYQNRGRWVTTYQEGITVPPGTTDMQAAVDLYAQQQLALVTPSQTIALNHGSVPGLELNDVVHFRRTQAGIDALFTISTTHIDFDPQQLASSTLVEVVDPNAADTEFNQGA